MIHLLSPEQLPTGVDPYNTADAPPTPDVIEWDDSTVEVVVLETPPEGAT